MWQMYHNSYLSLLYLMFNFYFVVFCASLTSCVYMYSIEMAQNEQNEIRSKNGLQGKMVIYFMLPWFSHFSSLIYIMSIIIVAKISYFSSSMWMCVCVYQCFQGDINLARKLHKLKQFLSLSQAIITSKMIEVGQQMKYSKGNRQHDVSSIYTSVHFL